MTVHPHPHLRGGAGSHLGLRRAAIFFVAGFLGLAALGAAITAIEGKPRPKAPCPPQQRVCANPPTPGGLQPRLVTETEYRDPQGRFRFEYPSDVLRVKPTADGVSVRLLPSYDQGDFLLTFQAASASTSPAALVRARLAGLSDRILGLTESTDPSQTVLGPEVGFHSGVGGSFEGTVQSAQGTSSPIHVIVMASSDGHSSVVMTIALSSTSQKRMNALLEQTDHLLNSFRYAPDVEAARPGAHA